MENESLYPILLLTCNFFIFTITYYLKGNGYLAVYIAGLVIGNSKFLHKKSLLKFFDGLAWLSQIIMFLMLGLLVNPHELIPVISVGLLIGLALMIIARPLSVMLTLLPNKKLRINEKLFISWVGLRGAVPIIFAILPLAAGITHARLMFNIVFFITLLSLLLQGTSITLLARILNINGPKKVNHKNSDHFGIEFNEDIKTTLSEVVLSEKTLENRALLMDFAFPDNTLVVMIKRQNNYIIPKGNTKLKTDDRLLIITNDNQTLEETYKEIGITDFTINEADF